MGFGEDLLRKIAGRREDAIGLDIGSGSIKMAEVSRRGAKLFLKKMAVMDIPEHAVDDGAISNEEVLADALQRMASKNGFSSAKVTAALGGRSLFIREVVFPRMSETEMRQAIRWDLEKYVPFSPEQLYFDFWIVGPGATDVDVRVLLVAVPKELVDTLVRVLVKAGLKPVAIEIEPLAVQRTLPEAEDCMLIDIGASLSQVTLFQKNSPVFTRNISIGGNQFTQTVMEGMHLGREEAEIVKLKSAGTPDRLGDTEAPGQLPQQMERVAGELAGEVRRTLEYYQVQNRNLNISRVFITGGGSKTEGLSAQLSQILELPVFLHDPLADMEVPASFNRQHLRGIGPQMAVAVGLAMRGAEL